MMSTGIDSYASASDCEYNRKSMMYKRNNTSSFNSTEDNIRLPGMDPPSCVQVAIRIKPLISLFVDKQPKGDNEIMCDENTGGHTIPKTPWCVSVYDHDRSIQIGQRTKITNEKMKIDSSNSNHPSPLSQSSTAHSSANTSSSCFTFDRIFHGGDSDDEEQVFLDMLEPLIDESCSCGVATNNNNNRKMNGKSISPTRTNTSILLYGEAKSGKTTCLLSPKHGLIPRSLVRIFRILGFQKAKEEHNTTTSNYKYQVSIQFVDLSNKDIIDLLRSAPQQQDGTTPTTRASTHYSSAQSVPTVSDISTIGTTTINPKTRKASNNNNKPTLRGLGNDSPEVYGVTTVLVSSVEEAMFCVEHGIHHRRYRHASDSDYTPSHAILTVLIRQTFNTTTTNTVGGTNQYVELHSKINFVDLASPQHQEVVPKSISFRHRCDVNKSLLVLGIVLSTLWAIEASNNRQKHKKNQLSSIKQKHNEKEKEHQGTASSYIPYRDSTLTSFLKGSLGGTGNNSNNSKTLFIACISPSETDYYKSLDVLRFANRIKNLKTNMSCITSVVHEEARGQQQPTSNNDDNLLSSVLDTTYDSSQLQQQQTQQRTSRSVSPIVRSRHSSPASFRSETKKSFASKVKISDGATTNRSPPTNEDVSVIRSISPSPPLRKSSPYRARPTQTTTPYRSPPVATIKEMRNDTPQRCVSPDTIQESKKMSGRTRTASAPTNANSVLNTALNKRNKVDISTTPILFRKVKNEDHREATPSKKKLVRNLFNRKKNTNTSSNDASSPSKPAVISPSTVEKKNKKNNTSNFLLKNTATAVAAAFRPLTKKNETQSTQKEPQGDPDPSDLSDLLDALLDASEQNCADTVAEAAKDVLVDDIIANNELPTDKIPTFSTSNDVIQEKQYVAVLDRADGDVQKSESDVERTKTVTFQPTDTASAKEQDERMLATNACTEGSENLIPELQFVASQNQIANDAVNDCVSSKEHQDADELLAELLDDSTVELCESSTPEAKVSKQESSQCIETTDFRETSITFSNDVAKSVTNVSQNIIGNDGKSTTENPVDNECFKGSGDSEEYDKHVNTGSKSTNVFLFVDDNNARACDGNKAAHEVMSPAIRSTDGTVEAVTNAATESHSEVSTKMSTQAPVTSTSRDEPASPSTVRKATVSEHARDGKVFYIGDLLSPGLDSKSSRKNMLRTRASLRKAIEKSNKALTNSNASKAPVVGIPPLSMNNDDLGRLLKSSGLILNEHGDFALPSSQFSEEQLLNLKGEELDLHQNNKLYRLVGFWDLEWKDPEERKFVREKFADKYSYEEEENTHDGAQSDSCSVSSSTSSEGSETRVISECKKTSSDKISESGNDAPKSVEEVQTKLEELMTTEPITASELQTKEDELQHVRMSDADLSSQLNEAVPLGDDVLIVQEDEHFPENESQLLGEEISIGKAEDSLPKPSFLPQIQNKGEEEAMEAYIQQQPPVQLPPSNVSMDIDLDLNKRKYGEEAMEQRPASQPHVTSDEQAFEPKKKRGFSNMLKGLRQHIQK